jgi:hypothetical protein
MHRIIYSLVFDLETEVPGAILQLIAPLNRDGQSPAARACAPKRRIIDLRAGDEIYHLPSGETSRIKNVQAYRDNWSENLPSASGDGYVVRRQ